MPSKQNNPYQKNISFNKQMTNIMRKVARALKQGDNTEAACLFAEGQEDLVVPADIELPGYLAKTFGIDVTSKLLKAFVRFPCGYCRNGHEKCPDCKGNGHLEDYIICDSCAGLGVSRCSFCNGSGLVATDSVPAGLRSIIVIERATIALEQVSQLLKCPVSRPSTSTPSNSRKANTHLLLELDRLMGTLENTLVTAKELVNDNNRAKDKITKIACLCVKEAHGCISQMQETIKWMAETAQLETEIANQDQKGYELASKRSDYYRSLYNSSDTFAGTCLDHPFMNEAIKKMFGKSLDAAARKNQKVIRKQ